MSRLCLMPRVTGYSLRLQQFQWRAEPNSLSNILTVIILLAETSPLHVFQNSHGDNFKKSLSWALWNDNRILDGTWVSSWVLDCNAILTVIILEWLLRVLCSLDFHRDNFSRSATDDYSRKSIIPNSHRDNSSCSPTEKETHQSIFLNSHSDNFLSHGIDPISKFSLW